MNELPDAQSKLWSLATDMSDGLKDHDPGVAQNTGSKLDADLKTAKETQDTYEKAGKAEDGATTARNVANSNAKAALALTKRQLGDVPGALTDIWKGKSTEIPDNLPDRITLLERAADYLKVHPDDEVEKKGFTEIKIRDAFTALQKARTDLNKAVQSRVDTKTARDAADKALRRRIRGLIDELANPGLFSPDDDRWFAFGLLPPAGVQRPGIAPDNITLRKIGPGTWLVAWSSTPRAQSYRPFYKVEPSDAAWIELPLQSDLDTLLENLPTTGTLKFQVQAHNAAGDSSKSEVAEVSLG
jgi:hypothetical protein